MKLSHIGDIHIEEGPRLNECALVLDAFIAESRKAQVDLIVMAGDLYHPHTTSKPATPSEELFAAGYLQRFAEIAPVVGVRGNHDVMGDVQIFNHLHGRHPIWFAERPHTYKFRTFDVLCLPWFDKAHLAAALPATVDAQETTRLTIEAAKELLLVMKGQASLTASEGRIPIGVGHLLAYGSVVSTGQQMMGVTVELTPYDLYEVGCAYFALSHVHKRQVWYDGAVAYAGSPMRHNFGEAETKGFNLVEIVPGAIRNDFVELPAKNILLLEADWIGEEALRKLREQGLNVCFASGQASYAIEGAMVRFRYHIHPKDLIYVDEQAIETILRADGATDVKIESRLVHETRIRSEEITIAKSAWDKVKAYWQAKGVDVGGDEEELRQLLSIVEGGEARPTLPPPEGMFPE